jgi:hypothetical protein
LMSSLLAAHVSIWLSIWVNFAQKQFWLDMEALLQILGRMGLSQRVDIYNFASRQKWSRQNWTSITSCCFASIYQNLGGGILRKFLTFAFLTVRFQKISRKMNTIFWIGPHWWRAFLIRKFTILARFQMTAILLTTSKCLQDTLNQTFNQIFLDPNKLFLESCGKMQNVK